MLPASQPAHYYDANRRPIFPKHTQVQNSTLAIHVPTTRLSCGIALYRVPACEIGVPSPAMGDGVVEAGEGIISGLILSTANIPVNPTMVDRAKPGFERSTRYHRTGLARESVRETWSVDCQGTLRCQVKHVSE